jgi:hypothetical protein
MSERTDLKNETGMDRKMKTINATLRATIALVGLASLFALSPASADQYFCDDVIVDCGSLCVGGDCVNGESFGFDTLRLKENNLRIKFQDTSSSASFPSNDWQLTANDSTNGGANRFSIDDIDGGRTPFTLEASAPSHSLYVDDGGRIGNGTSIPVVDLHVKSGNTPTLRLEQDGSSGFTPQTWDVAGNEANFFVRDVTNGSTLVLRIRPGAPTSAIDIAAGGDVGIGTSAPAARLHVNGGAIIEGDVALGSSRSFKHEIEHLDSGSVLDAIRNLHVYTWKYKSDAERVAHVGPMAEDIHDVFGIGRDRKHLSPADTAGLAIAAIQGVDGRLDQELDELRTTNAELVAQNRGLRLRLAVIEERIDALLVDTTLLHQLREQPRPVPRRSGELNGQLHGRGR